MPSCVRAPARPALLPALVLLAVQAAADYGNPIQINWDNERTPLSHMVDITNGFGLKVLAEHNLFNENNIAFSPYGLMGILVALYEGVDGESSYQIQRGMQLPWNRNVMRVGFRDIHRTLKTYFVPEEGFLAGLTLNNENVTFSKSYKNILQFYGFDLESDQLQLANKTDEPSTSSSTGIGTATIADDAAHTTPGRELFSTDLSREELTINPNAEIINDIDIPTPIPGPMTDNSTSAFDAEYSNILNTTLATDRVTTAETVGATLSIVDINEITTELLQLSTTTTDITKTIPSLNTVATARTSPGSGINEEAEVSTSSSTTNVMSTDFITEQTTGNDGNLPATSPTTLVLLTERAEQLTITSSAALETESTPRNSEYTVEELERRKKSLVNFIFTSPPYIDDNLSYRAFEIPPPSNSQSNDVRDNQMFLAHGLKSVQVSYMRYEAVLPHAFLPHLEAAALRLPLDSARYYLLALRPARATPAALPRLLHRLARHSDLRDVYAALRPRRVSALLPSFTLKGHVILTADLKKVALVLGINGACRCIELTNNSVNDVEYYNNMILVKLRDTKTKIDRMFVVRDEFLTVVQKYEALRPVDTNTDRFFVNYRNGKCTRQPIGRHTIASMPKTIATFLNLPNIDSYTGHCFRRSSATLRADSGANLTTLKRHGGWRSDQVAEGYIEDSIENKSCISKQINKSIRLISSTTPPLSPQPSTSHQKENVNSPQPSTSRQRENINSPQPSTSRQRENINTPQPSTSRQTENINSPRPLASQESLLPPPSPISSIQQNNIKLPGKTIYFTFKNCPNMSNITFTINN